MEQAMNYIRPELLVMVPVLFFIGVGLKKSGSVADRHIPIYLGLAGIFLAVLWVLATTQMAGYQDALMAAFVAVTQGILAAGCSVYVHQIIKQECKKEK